MVYSADMSTTVTIHEEGMRCCTVWEPSGQKCCTDVAACTGGKGEFPTPAAMLTASVASCMLSMIAWTGKSKNFDTKGISIESGYESNEQGKIVALNFQVTVPFLVTPAVGKMMQAAAALCPVGALISPGVEKKITWNWFKD